MRATTRDSLVILGILAALAGMTAALVYWPQARRLDRIRNETVGLRMSLAQDAERANVVSDLLRQVQQLKSQYKDFDRRLPKEKELGGFLREISGSLAEENLTNQLIQPGNPVREELFHTLPIVMQFQGSYLSLADFLKRVEKMERLTRVQKLDAKADPKQEGLNIQLQLNIYFHES